MKWSEFKKYIDDKIKESNSDDPPIEYIDVSHPDLDYPMSTPEVIIDGDGLSIWT